MHTFEPALGNRMERAAKMAVQSGTGTVHVDERAVTRELLSDTLER